MRQMLLASLLAAFAAGGCVGGITGGNDDTPPGDDGGGDDTPPAGVAKKMFEDNVYPILATKCSSGCHLADGTATSTSFVGTSKATSYNTVIGYTSVVGNFTLEGAPIWGKIMTGPMHNARTYTAPEQTAVTNWLAQEVLEREDPGTPPPGPGDETPGAATARLISEWSGCLKQTDFEELRFGEVWANKGTNEGNCEQCHQDGAYGMFANDDNVRMYQTLSGNKFFMVMFFKPNVVDLTMARMETNPQTFINVGQNIAPYIEHPTFDPNQNSNDPATPPLAVLEELYTRTAGYLAAGTCGPPIIP